jgi:DNA polymerase-3 subunit chi
MGGQKTDMTLGEPVTAAAPEVLFYHLERRPLEAVIPQLLERTLERGWRAVVQAGTPERLESLDTHLWTYAEESFLPHGTRKDGSLDRQPIYLTTADDNPNAARVRFLVDGAIAAQFEGYERIVYLFDGRDSDAVAQARGEWKRAKAAGCTVTYWQQAESGRWEKRA